MEKPTIAALERILEIVFVMIQLARDPVPGKDATLDNLEKIIEETLEILELEKKRAEAMEH